MSSTATMNSATTRTGTRAPGGATAPRGPRGTARTVAALLALAAMLAGLLGVGTVPAAAHSGGKAVVLVKDLTVAPSGKDWTATAVLVDYDSGDAITGGGVKLLTGSPAKTSTLQESGPGVYTGTVDGAKEGQVTMGVQVRSLPGQVAVAPFNKEFSFTLVSGQPTQVIQNAPLEDSGGSNMPLILGVVVAVLIAALLYGLFAIRRRTSVPVRAK